MTDAIAACAVKTSALLLEKVHKNFGPIEIIRGVDLDIKQGERHAIIGPNGAGKTTLFNLITGTYRPSRGRVFFKGRDVTGFQPHELSRIGMGRSFQLTSTFGRLSTFQNIRL